MDDRKRGKELKYVRKIEREREIYPVETRGDGTYGQRGAGCKSAEGRVGRGKKEKRETRIRERREEERAPLDEGKKDPRRGRRERGRGRENRVGEASKLELIGGGRIAGTNAEGRPQRKRPSGDVTLIPPGRAYKMAAGVPFLPCYSYGVGFRLSRSLCLTGGRGGGGWRYVCANTGRLPWRRRGRCEEIDAPWRRTRKLPFLSRIISLGYGLEETTTGWLAGWLAGWMGERRRVTSAEGIELSTEAEGATSKDKLPA